jgi:hypothetical protein
MTLVETDVHMILGGSTEPAYSMTISALTPEIAATKNKRSAYLLQHFMHDTLKIEPRRGVIRYQAITEENLATNGMTALQEIEQLERQSHEGEGGFGALSRQKSRKARRSNILNAERKTPTPGSRAMTPSLTPAPHQGTTSARLSETLGMGRWKLKPRKSIFGFFRRGSDETLKE